ncbi:Phosphoribosyltransferase domain protein [Arcticibacter svalbardensis MN12-7]|uniref:Phosphoribosyltransferase domain protein n=1 Tax=Arcticibacter svalbardensis MN12-7 TaxID=1150600 RepID=R9GT35_9SPHI|nr:ComF family protein [Arcticibacter svalbardensis]EOR95022.1 Phosphoribosyltransferase domain protein [Arcticibacter svalbardensis MN12-7]
MLHVVKQYADDFLSLFFPQVCCACGKHLVADENLLCTACIYNLPYTNFHLQPDNPVARQFWGRVPLVYAGAFFYFHKHTNVQDLIHQLKYKNKPELGHLIGRMYGKVLYELVHSSGTDLLIPVPLHHSRLKERGYNQSYCIAAGLSTVLEIPVSEQYLIRHKATDTQTHKNRFSRFENMTEVFTLEHAHELEGKHILLVDDVVTTGATLESCASMLLTISGVRVSIVSIAFAH